MEKIGKIRTLIDHFESELRWLSPSNPRRTFQKELTSLKIFLGCYENWSRFFEQDSPSAIKALEALDSLAELAIKAIKALDSLFLAELEGDTEVSFDSQLIQLIDSIKSILKESILDLTNLSLECECSRKDDFIKLIGIATNSLKDDLLVSEPSVEKTLMEAIIKRLKFVFAIFHFGSSSEDQFNSFFNRFKDWSNCAVAVSFLYWVDKKDRRLNDLACHLIEKFKESIIDLTNLSLEFECSCKDDFIQLINIAINSLKDDLLVSEPSVEKTLRRAIIKRLEFVFAIFHCGSSSEDQLNSFFNRFKDLAKCAVLYWVDKKDERLNNLACHLIEKFKPSTLELAELYLGPLMALKPITFADWDLTGTYLCLKRAASARFVEVLVEDLVLPTDDGFEMFQHELTFFVSFLINPPRKYANDNSIDHISVKDAAYLISSLYTSNLKEGIAKGSNILLLLHDLVEKINRAKYSSSLNNFSRRRTDDSKLWNFFLENLFEKLMYAVALTTYQRNQITTIQKELLSLKPLIIGAFELQDENGVLKDLRMQICSMIYRAEYVIDSYSLSDPIHYWHNAMCLSDVTEEIQSIQAELNKSQHPQIMYEMRAPGDEMNSGGVLPPQAYNINDDVMVGFEDKKEEIINCLTGGLPQCHIVAIVGMGGQGKTTLAKKLYHDSRARLHFKRFAWCCISQTYNIKAVFIDILKQVDPKFCEDDEIFSKSHEDLAEMLYRCLKGRPYLIVLDDIWSIGPWNDLKASFPDDDNGSRIVFTSRMHNIALEAKSDCSIHELHLLSFEDSWKLLQLRLPDLKIVGNLLDIGKEIAKKCRGLPLAVVITAGLLAKVDANMANWKKVAESLNSQVAREGCMDILELSYKHLPDYLKPCFLYLAAFKEDSQILVKRLSRFWIAEGFIRKHESKSLEDVANEYLMDLVSRSLLFVAKRTSKYGIRKCVIHDLVRELCLVKAKEENLLLFSNFSYNDPIDTIHQSYQLDFHAECRPSFELQPTIPKIGNLPCRESINIPMIVWFRYLRVLRLVNCKIHDTNAISQQVHLYYLEIARDYRGAIRLPPSIVNLSRLQFLILDIVEVPKSILNMRNLQHLDLCVTFYGTDDLIEESLQLHNLETYSSDHIYTENEFMWLLERMPNVRKLNIRLNFCARLSTFLSKLDSLNLSVRARLSTAKFDLPSTLRKLTMNDSYRPLSASIMSLIGELPNLEVLKLLDVDFEDRRWDVKDEEFLNLKYLQVYGSNIKEWHVSTNSFSQLQQLILRVCHYLTEFPFIFGERHTLKVIKVLQCNESLANSLGEIIAELRDLGDAGLQITTDFPELRDLE